MSTVIRIGAAVLCGLTLSSCRTTQEISRQQGAQLSAADVRSIGSIDGRYNEALRQGDLETAVRTIYSPDVIMMPGDGPPFKGHEALIDHLRSLQAENWEHRAVSTTGRGDLAVQISEWKLSAVVDGARVNFAGGCMDILKRQPDGRWVVVAETFTAFPNQDFPGLQNLVRGTSVSR
jgi:ketosteroid isomerase-like protein